MTSLVQEIIENEKSYKTGILNLNNTGLIEIPLDLAYMPWLKQIFLCHNRITKLSNLENLNKLEKLIAFNNRINSLSGIEKLTNLNRLDLSDNSITNIDNLSFLPNLTELYLSRNPIKNVGNIQNTNPNLTDIFLDETGISSILGFEEFLKRGLNCSITGFQDVKNPIYLKGCPLSEGLIVLIRQGTEHILNFIADSKEQGEDSIFEARLFILGEAGVGKTTLARKIVDVNSEMPDEKDDTTIGIHITTKVFMQQSEHKPEFRMNIWDFGGQEIYHSTHQLFLSNRSLYVIVGNGRQEDDPELYWLPIQKMLAKDSPVLILVNKRGELRHKIPINQLKSRFQNLQGEIALLNLNEDKDSILEFTDSLEYYIRRLPQFQRGEKLPRKWIGIRESLSKLNRNYISIIEFNLICDEHGIKDNGKQKFILEYLNDIGAILYFNITYLDKLVILNTAWLTNAIYKVFNHTEQRNKNGRFTQEDIELVWNTDDYLIYKDEILLIMEHFDLCYRIGSSNLEYVVPKLVQVDQPININWKQEGVLRIRYEYDVMPKGILQRLIVRKNNLLASNKNVWQYGCLFNYLDAEALVLLESQNKIIISAKGENRSNLFNILCVEIDQINKDYQFSEDLKVDKLVPCICPNCITQPAPSYYKYDVLERMYANKIMEVRCPKEFQNVKILDLLNIISNSTKVSDSISVFISYSKEDKNYLTSLKKHLSPYKNKLNLWEDHKLMAGENWNKSIQNRLYEAEIIIFLVSASLFSTDYIMDIELRIAKERLDNKHNITVIPIIIRECNWEDSAFGMLNALPFKGKPISLFKNKDTAWKQVVSEIVKVIEEKTTANMR